MRLPTIDIAPFLRKGTAEAKQRVAEELDHACREFGAFYLTGHGLDGGELLRKMNSFFSTAAQEKRRIAIQPGGFTRGYIGMGEESGSAALEVKEAFSYGFPWQEGAPARNAMQGPNVWPEESALPGWRTHMEKFFADMVHVAEGLVRAFSLSYGYEEGHLSGYCREGATISLMRLFHYFPYQNADRLFPDRQDRIGSSAHTDWGFLTLILQEERVTGLQFFHENEWKDIPPVPGTLLVNCGDYFSLLTGGDYKSPLHRVVSSVQERTSGVLFYYPDYDARIPSLGKQHYSLFSNQEQEAATEAITDPAQTPFGEFILRKWEQVRRKT